MNISLKIVLWFCCIWKRVGKNPNLVFYAANELNRKEKINKLLCKSIFKIILIKNKDKFMEKTFMEAMDFRHACKILMRQKN